MLTPTIVILGNGNVATHLSEALLNAGYSVLQLWKRGKALRDADLYFIAVSDDAIEEVANLIPEGKRFAHTSGSVDLPKGGVFYPLQTFSKQMDVDWKTIPILIEAKDQQTEDCLLEIAKHISDNVQLVDAEKRRLIHLAAVFACNFTNHLWALSEELLAEKNLSFDLLKPLIYQAVRKIEQHHPKDVQTGPAVRNDLKTLDIHRDILGNGKACLTQSRARPAPTVLDIYTLLSKSIQDHGSH